MGALNQIININISLQAAAIPQVGFGIPLIVGPTGFGASSDVIRYYSGSAALLADGFLASSPEYTYAAEAFSQALSPTLVGVGKRTNAVAQVDTLAVNALTVGYDYTFDLDGALISYIASGSDTQQSVLSELLIAINAAFPLGAPVTGVVTGTGGAALLTLTGASPGLGVAYSGVASELTHVSSTAVNGISNDLAAIQNVSNGNLWYGMALCSNIDYDILQSAAYIEATGSKIFVGASADANIATSITTDLASQLQKLAYTRTALMYSPGSAHLGIDAAWLGLMLPQVPGSNTWKFKTLTGVSPDFFPANQRTLLIGAPGVSFGKGANIYETVGGVNITEEGWMAGGQFIDVTIGTDWLKATMQTNIYFDLVNMSKVPYTDQGVGIIESAIRTTLRQGVHNGFIADGTITISVVPVANIPANTRALRILPNSAITWSARLAGALHFIQLNGTITD